MQQFSIVLLELRKWFESLRWFGFIRRFELQLLFGGLGVLFLEELLFAVLPYQSFYFLSTIFHTIPLSTLASYAFLIGAWSSLVSGNVKYVPYGLWFKAFLILFPFVGISLGTLISAAVYVFLGYILFKFTVSPYSAK
ncbi:hypothetical protein V3851_16515 [Paenibacillus sp. M1]|uniref:Uncharacterized protein n=1 Tax=Paenibacillus haidiansis TaxID=1574488 RepID=A0ABU7VUI9_9BACL